MRHAFWRTLGVAVLGLVMGAVFMFTLADRGHGDVGGATPLKAGPAPTYSRNASGQTYGSEAQAATPEQAPDLIAVLSTTGADGYVRKTDMYPPLPKSPDEALKLRSARREVPVYAVDGVTRVGSFVLEPLGSISTSAP